MSIEVRELNVHRGKRAVLEAVDLTVNRGELTVVIGANGAGKSTLLEAVAGDLPVRSGSIQIGGQALSDWSPRHLAQHRAVLRQSPRLDLSFTVLEVVLMGRTPHIQKHESRADLRIAMAALEQVDLMGFAQRLYPNLSGGEQQRVHLARVLAQVWIWNLEGQELNRPEIGPYLLLDEPTSNLDIHAQHLVLACARRFTAAGGTVLCVLHDINLAAQYADRVLVLETGKILAYGPPSEVLETDLLAQAFNVDSTVIRAEGLSHPVVVAQPIKTKHHGHEQEKDTP